MKAVKERARFLEEEHSKKREKQMKKSLEAALCPSCSQRARKPEWLGWSKSGGTL